MAQETIPDLNPITELDGTEQVPVDDGIQTYKATVSQFLDYIEENIDLTGTGVGSDISMVDNGSITATATTGALTISLKNLDGSANPNTTTNKVIATFRSNTIGSGAKQKVAFTSALSIVIPSTATMGYANGDNAKVNVYLYFDGTNKGLLVSSADLNEQILHTLAAIGIGSDDNGKYADAIRTNAAIRLIGYIQVTAITTAGTWTTPNIISTIKATNLAPLAVSKAVKTDSAGAITTFDTSTEPSIAELAFLKGVTSAIQTQFQLQKFKANVRVATVTAGTLASSFENGDTVDGVTLATGDRILIKNQSSGSENGIYTVNASGAPTRAVDFDTWAKIPGSFVPIDLGTVNAGRTYQNQNVGGGTLNTTAIVFWNLNPVWTTVEDTNASNTTINTDFGGPGGNTYMATGLSVTFNLIKAQTIDFKAVISGSSNDANCNPILGLKVDSGTTLYGTHGALGTGTGSASRMSLSWSRETDSLAPGSHSVELRAAKGTGTSWTLEGINAGVSGIGIDCRLQCSYWDYS